MNGILRARLRRLRERLWFRPLVYCLAAGAMAAMARIADPVIPPRVVPDVSADTIRTLLTVITSSMLAVATLAVGSMLSAYASASGSATPRSFALIVADDRSQAALSSFIGAFIFAVLAVVALDSGIYGVAGRFVLFVLTLAIFAWVILTFLAWVDGIARLGRMGNTIDRVEAATAKALTARAQAPTLGGLPAGAGTGQGQVITGTRFGYVRSIDMETLQKAAERLDTRVKVEAMPGALVAPGRAVLRVEGMGPIPDDIRTELLKGIVIGDDRGFDEDPRFGLIVLSEIAARALSPGVNDPGTAIVIIGRFVRLIANWAEPVTPEALRHDRVMVPRLDVDELFGDAFLAISRDGAGTVEVGIRLQKALLSLAHLQDAEVASAARRASARAVARARAVLSMPEDIERLEDLAAKVAAA